jgi:hypothetical protein
MKGQENTQLLEKAQKLMWIFEEVRLSVALKVILWESIE